MILKNPRISHSKWLSVPLVSVLAACGGSGGGGSDSDSTTLSGSVFASAVEGASCLLTDSSGGQIGDAFTTTTGGGYSVEVPDVHLDEDLIVICSGGQFTDEATGLSDQAAGTLAAFIAGGTNTSGTSIHVTPSSTILHHLITEHGKTVERARELFEGAFGFELDQSVEPTDATDPEEGAGDDRLLGGLRAATFSQLAHDLELSATEQFALISALADDLADGELDGEDENGTAVVIEGTSTAMPTDIHNRFSQALVNFRNGGHDSSGLTNSELGVLPFAKETMTDSYYIEYVEGMHSAINGKTSFSLSIEDHSGQVQTGLNVMIKPTMNMAEMTHGTAFEQSCGESDTAGTYDCTVYYLMPSVMHGTSMGFWELKIMIGGHDGEHAMFYPTVGMAMGDTAQVRLRGQDDKISAAMDHDSEDDDGHDHHHSSAPSLTIRGMEDMSEETESRTYYLFKRALTGEDNDHTFELFLAAKEDADHYPPVYTGATLNADSMHYELAISTMSVEVSTDAENWIVAEEGHHHGHWSASGITGLSEGVSGTLYVRLIVEGEQKTTDGLALNADAVTEDTNNHFARFTVTPGGSMMSM